MTDDAKNDKNLGKLKSQYDLKEKNLDKKKKTKKADSESGDIEDVSDTDTDTETGSINDREIVDLKP